MHLTLGVAVLGSLLGGVQLFAMIKMLGLQLVDIEKQYSNRPDLNQQQNIWAAYQVIKYTKIVDAERIIRPLLFLIFCLICFLNCRFLCVY